MRTDTKLAIEKFSFSIFIPPFFYYVQKKMRYAVLLKKGLLGLGLKKWEAFVTMGAEKTSERGDDMTALEFIHKHQNDEDNGECLILPDGSVEEPLPSHIGRLVELTGMDAGALHGRMEKNMEPLFWLVEYTGCMSVWQTRVVAPTVPTGQQQAALEELHDAAFLAPKYLMQTPGQEYVESVHQAKEELRDR